MNRILWIDDEIDFLKPHIMFLEGKGYEVTPVVSGADALAMLKLNPNAWDVILLDENMPGLTGLETLEKLKLVSPQTPVVMITKSEEENLMDQAVGNQIKDYLIKPVNPNQILHTLKRLLHAPQLASRQATVSYHREFVELASMISRAAGFDDWCEIYRRLTLRLMELNETAPNVEELLRSQQADARKEFFRFIRREYPNWFKTDSAHPVMSHHVLDRTVRDSLAANRRATLMVMDNFRLDQWFAVKSIFTEHFDIDREELCCGLLPTATQYARNAVFSGLLPAEIKHLYPQLWVDEDSEEGKNLNEETLVRHYLQRKGLGDRKMSFHKANNSSQLNALINSIGSDSDDLTVIVVNFLDILAHAKTESNMVRELASTDAAYRSLTTGWFRHSPFGELLAKIARTGRDFYFTTDHGSIRVKKPVKIVAERNTTTALRYKHGRNLAYPSKEVMAVTRPSDIGLPSQSIATTYIFAGEDDFFAYQNNFNHYARHYTDTYQHGGVSMEEMILPLVTFKKKT